MAIVVNDVSYAGEVANYFFALQIEGNSSIEQGALYLQDGIAKSLTIPRMEITSFFQKRVSKPVSSVGTVTVTGNKLEPQSMMIYTEFEPSEFEANWLVVQQMQEHERMLDRQLPLTAENMILDLIMRKSSRDLEHAMWRGRLAYGDATPLDPTTKGETADAVNFKYFNGLIFRILSDTTTLKVASPVALTETNIYDKLKLAYALIPKAIRMRYGKDGVKLYMSVPDHVKYGQYLENQPYKNQDATQVAPRSFKGYNVLVLNGLPENTFFFGIGNPDTSSNFWVGSNSSEDDKLQVARTKPADETFFVKGLMKMDTNIGFGAEIVLYSTITL